MSLNESGVLGTQRIAQIGIIVHDIEAASQTYANFLGVDKPKWFWTDHVEVAQTEYNGASSEARAKLAFFNMGSVQLELIEPDHHPSTWRDFLNTHGEGVHHLAFVVKDLKNRISVMEKDGMRLQQKGEYTGGRYAYMDTTESLKILLELLENDN